MKCEFCGKKIDTKEKRIDGLPAGVGFELEDRRIVNVCTDCILTKNFKELMRVSEGAADD